MRPIVLVVCGTLILTAGNLHAQSILPAAFVTNNVGDSVTSFTVNPDGTLTRVNVFPSGDGPQTCSLSPDGRWLAVANGTASTTTEEIRIFQVNPDATLTHRLTTTVPDSPLDVQWYSNTALAVTQTNLSVANAVQMLEWNSVGNSLSQIDIEPTGSFNTRLASARNGSLMFANNTSGGNSIRSFTVDGAGQMNLVENELTGSNFAVDVAASRDGNFLYGAGGISGDGNRILGFAVDGAGAMTPLPAISFTSPGESPKVIAITGDDRILVAGHGTDATFWSFIRDPLTGNLTATSSFFDIGLQGTLGDIQIMGNLLFVTDSSTATDGISGLYSFRVNADGSFTQLGPILDTLGTRPEYIATWAGVPEPSAVALAGLALAGAARRNRRSH